MEVVAGNPIEAVRTLVVDDPEVTAALLEVTDHNAFARRVVDVAGRAGIALTPEQVVAALADERLRTLQRWV